MENALIIFLICLVITGIVLGLFMLNMDLAVFRKKLSMESSDWSPKSRAYRIVVANQRVLWVFFSLFIAIAITISYLYIKQTKAVTAAVRQLEWPVFDPQKLWVAPSQYLAETDDHAALIQYGRDLVARTQDYFGEYGIVKPGTINGLNCQNCHLDAGSRPFGNNYFAVQSNYPQMRPRSGALETIPKRINDCFQRSLNGQPLDTTGKEMRAIMAYIEWLGTGVPKGAKPKGTGLVELPFLERPADSQKGRGIYLTKCASCHGADGQGLPIPESARDYPALWGEKSYNESAGLYRLSRLAGYVKANMPFGATYDNPQLSDEEAWDVAAYINSQPRPRHPFLNSDWPKIEKKPYDHPFGPFADTFPEIQHKYGPFGPIKAFYANNQKNN